ncbi:cupin domain-containing protein [Paraburkholderia sp. JHI869]
MKCLRIYADAQGESHFEDIDIPLTPLELFPNIPPIYLSTWEQAKAVRFGWVPAGLKEADWHTTPVRQFVIWMTGWVEFETSDGDTRHCEPGTVVLCEDTVGKGHRSRHPEEGQFNVFIPLAD